MENKAISTWTQCHSMTILGVNSKQMVMAMFTAFCCCTPGSLPLSCRICPADLAHLPAVARVDRQFQLGCPELGLFFESIRVQLLGLLGIPCSSMAEPASKPLHRCSCTSPARSIAVLAYAELMTRAIEKKR